MWTTISYVLSPVKTPKISAIFIVSTRKTTLNTYNSSPVWNPWTKSGVKKAITLIRIFDLWFEDLKKSHYVSIRHIDNWIGILLGQRPEACSMNGRCSIQFVVEGDGSVYPCDFYVTDEWKMGNVNTDTFAQMLRGPKAQSFIAASIPLPNECRNCPILSLCRNGCRRDRLMTEQGYLGKTYYCKAHLRFFTARQKQILQARSIIIQMRQANQS